MAHERTSGISRRTLLKGAVAAGGLAWAAPSIVTQSVSAQASCPGAGSCPNSYMVKLELFENQTPGVYVQNGQIKCFDIRTTGNFCLSTPTTGTLKPFNCAQHSQYFTVDPTSNENQARVTLNNGCRYIEAKVKKGSGANRCTVSSTTIDPTCTTATFGPSSHIEFSFCCGH